MNNSRPALLVSGGIGDFLHYILRFSSFMQSRALNPAEVNVFVESTKPKQVESLFRVTLPGVAVHFVPAQLHWTKTNPLLSVDCLEDRINRPAYRYVLSQGFSVIEDWFLPFLCKEYPADYGRLEFLRANRLHGTRPQIIASIRDKGFLWWPSEVAFAELRRCVPNEYELVFVGTEDERLPGAEEFVTTPTVADGLTLSCNAALFVGTDTGFATARELFGLPNIYCVDRYWFENLMVRYKYWDDSMAERTRSYFAFSVSDLKSVLTAFFS
jgi:hypothetical protein